MNTFCYAAFLNTYLKEVLSVFDTTSILKVIGIVLLTSYVKTSHQTVVYLQKKKQSKVSIGCFSETYFDDVAPSQWMMAIFQRFLIDRFSKCGWEPISVMFCFSRWVFGWLVKKLNIFAEYF